jgi:hypothetical protein
MNKLELALCAGLALGTTQAAEAKNKTGPEIVDIKPYKNSWSEDNINQNSSEDSEKSNPHIFDLFLNTTSYTFQNNIPTNQQTTGQVQTNFRTSRTIIPPGNSPDNHPLTLREGHESWRIHEKEYANKLMTRLKSQNMKYNNRVHSSTNGPYFRT